MRILKSFFLSFLLIFLIAGCKDSFLDEIKTVEPGEDLSAPEVTVSYPVNGTEIQVYETVTSIDIEFEASDDIELASINLEIDGTQIASFNEFTDYRRFVGEYTYSELQDGDHVLEVTATDINGKTTVQTINFSKIPPYVTKYDGEVFYMPFDNDNVELVGVTFPTEVGNMGFAGEGKVGGNSLSGATGSYLSIPVTDILEDEFSAVFWMKIDNDPNRAGILTIGPPDVNNANYPDAQNLRTSGIRFFRENGANGNQRFKLNVGTGSGETWVDGGAAADVAPNTGEWVHFAFTISNSEAIVYINGQPVRTSTTTGVDWTDCDILTIMSGAPRFSEWGHLSDLSYMDELRLFNKSLSQNEILTIINDEGGTVYNGEFGEKFYMDFEGNYVDAASGFAATQVGTLTLAGEGLRGSNSFQAATDAYATFPSNGIEYDEFSASFWYKLDATPDRAGILTIGPPHTANANYPTTQNLRTSGFRFFRENAGGMQRFKLNVGTGAGEVWVDGGAAADVDPATATDWIHMAITISGSVARVYIDGVMVKESDLPAGFSWADCDIMSIGSGAPRFNEWGHLSDLSLIDELRIFDKALTQSEVDAIKTAR